MKTLNRNITTLLLAASLAATLAACNTTPLASGGCSQLELSNGVTGADCGAMSPSELAGMQIDG